MDPKPAQLRPMPPPSHSDVVFLAPPGRGKSTAGASLKEFFAGPGHITDGVVVKYLSSALFDNTDRLNLDRVGTIRSTGDSPEFMSCQWPKGAFNVLIPPGEALQLRGAYETSHVFRLAGSAIVVMVLDLRTHPEISPYSTRAMAYWAMAPKRLHDGKPVASKLNAVDALALSLSIHYGIDRDLIYSPALAAEEPVFRPLQRLQPLLQKAAFGFNPVHATSPEKRYPLLGLNASDVARVNVALGDIVTVLSRAPERFYDLLHQVLRDPSTRVVGTVAALDLAKYWPGVDIDPTSLIHKVVAPRRGVATAIGRYVDYRITIDGATVETCYAGVNHEGPRALWNALKPLMEEDLRSTGRRVGEAVKSLFGGFRRRPAAPAKKTVDPTPPDASVVPQTPPSPQSLIPPRVAARAGNATNGFAHHD